MKNTLFILLAFLFIFACDPVDNSKDDSSGPTALVETEDAKYTLNGKSENGPCKKPGTIIVNPLDSDLFQVGPSFRGQIQDDSGAFIVRGITEATHAFYEAPNLTCYNEVSSLNDTGVKHFSLADLTEVERNINPLTSIKYFVSISYFDNPRHADYNNIYGSLARAEIDILDYFDMPETGVKFSEMTLQGDRLADGVLGFIDSMIAKGRNGPEQNSYMLDIAKGVINQDQDLKLSILRELDNLPIYKIVNNLRNEYERLGLGRLSPPIWLLSDYDYYTDLLTRIPEIQINHNPEPSRQCSFDQSTFDTFALPRIWDNRILTSKYFAADFPKDAQVSIWTVSTDINTGLPIPGTKLQDLTTLREILIDPIKSYNGMFDAENMPVPGNQYFIKIVGKTTFALSKNCAGPLLPFGQVQASNDNGVTWLGPNTTDFFIFDYGTLTIN